MGFAWDAPDIETLKTLWTEGLTASQIAAALQDKYTRSAICAKASRMNLPIRAGIAERRASGTPYNHCTKPHIHRQYPPKLKLVKIEPDGPGPDPIGPIADWGPPNTCQYMHGSVREPDWRFCAHPGVPWCSFHAAICVVKPHPPKS